MAQLAMPNFTPFPAVKPGHRLVPARIGTWDRNQIAYIECPNWCTEDHLESPSYIEDIDHATLSQGITVPTFIECDDDHYWTSRLEADPNSDDERMRDVHVVAGDDSRFEARLTAEMAEQLADELIGFASQLRHQARTCRLANQTAGDSDPDMDEALRRVRNGRTA